MRCLIILCVLSLYSCNSKSKIDGVKIEKYTDTLAVGQNFEDFITTSLTTTKYSIKEHKFEKNIPKGYKVLSYSSGYLNSDKILDILLVLKRVNEYKLSKDSGSFISRPLLICLGDSKGNYRTIRRNDKLVFCLNCEGIYGDPFLSTAIKDRCFSIDNYGGSSERWRQSFLVRRP